MSPRFSPTTFYRNSSSALLHLVDQCLNFTYSHTRVFRYYSTTEARNKNYDVVKNRTHDLRTIKSDIVICGATTIPLGRRAINTVHVCMDQPGTVTNPALGVSEERKIDVSLSPFAPENFVSRDGFGSSPVPRRPAQSGAYSRDSSRVPRRRPFSYLNRQPPSGQSRVYRVTHLRTDGVHCREPAGTGSVVLKVVPVTGAAFSGVTMDRVYEYVEKSLAQEYKTSLF